MTHDERMELAGRLRDLILDRYAASVLAVFVTSSTARGLDLEFSDLELTTVHRDGAAPSDRSYYHRGILIEVSHVEESKILAPQMKARWPEMAGGYRGRIVLYEHDRWTERLDQALDALDATDRVPAQRTALLDLLEYRDKLRNARLTGDEVFLRGCAPGALGVQQADAGEILSAVEALSEGLTTMAAAHGIVADSEELLV